MKLLFLLLLLIFINSSLTVGNLICTVMVLCQLPVWRGGSLCKHVLNGHHFLLFRWLTLSVLRAQIQNATNRTKFEKEQKINVHLFG